MDRRLVSGSVTALAALALALTGAAGGGGTDAAFTDRTTVPDNTLGAGSLVLDVARPGGAGTELDFDGLLPAAVGSRRMWVVANDPASTPGATLVLTLRNLRDTPAPCATGRSKALAEQASGVPGCVVTPGSVSGTPAQGNLSRLLAVTVTARPGTAATCAQPGDGTPLLTGQPGNLYALARGGVGTTVAVVGADGSPLRLSPGAGVCVEVTATWPPSTTTAPDPEHPLDNAAQGDSLSVEAVFTLEQVRL